MKNSFLRVLLAVLQREFCLVFRQKSELLQPMFFFLMVITLFPIAIGPNLQTLQTLSGGIIWVAAILALLMSLDKIFRDDHQQGCLEQMVLAPFPLYMTILIKVFVHWASNIVPIIILSPLLAMFLNMSLDIYWALMLTLIIGTPTISLVGAIGVALTLGLQRQGALVALLLIPLFIPLLIFATKAIEFASLQLPYTFQIAILTAMLLCALALAPLTISKSIQVSQY